MKTVCNILFALLLSLAPVHSETCKEVQKITIEQVAVAPDAVLSVVDELVNKFPECSCEIVKAAIQTTKADAKLVGKIVDIAIQAAPEQMRMIAQCAIAAAPDAVNTITKVWQKYQPDTTPPGYSSAKDCKDSKGKEVLPPGLPDPLDKIFWREEPPIIVVPVTDVRCRWYLPPGLPPTSTPIISTPPTR